MLRVSNWTLQYSSALCGPALAAGLKPPFVVAQSRKQFVHLHTHSSECKAEWSTRSLGFLAEVLGFTLIGPAWFPDLSEEPCLHVKSRWKLAVFQKHRCCKESRAEGKLISSIKHYVRKKCIRRR